MSKRNPQSLLKGALILSVAAVLTKILGAMFFKIPLQKLNEDAAGYFTVAYDIYTPIYIVATAGFPVATSRMVSQAIANRKYRDVHAINRVAVKIFLITGTIGTLAMVASAFVIPSFIDQPIKLTLLIMAPAILFSGMEGAYRGVYEGTQNMYPTAITQIIESVVKLALGLFLAYTAYYYGIAQFQSGLPVYGKLVATKAEAIQRTLPYISAGAMIGVTVGAFIAIMYLVIRYRVKGAGITRDEIAVSEKPTPQKTLAKTLIMFAIPVALGTLATQITSLIDSVLLGRTIAVLSDNHNDLLRETYRVALGDNFSTQKMNDFLVGTRGIANTYVNLIPNITFSLGVSALPILTAAWSEGNKTKVRKNTITVLRATLLIAFPSGIGLSFLAKPIMEMIYGTGTSAHLVAGPQLQILGIAVIFICLVAPIQSMLQAMGRADISAKLVIVGGIVKLVFNQILVPIPQLNILGAAYSTLISYIVMAGIGLYSLQKAMGSQLKWKRIVFGPLIASLGCGGASVLANFLTKKVVSPRISTVVAIFVAIIVYVFLLFFLNVVTKEEILMLPKGEKIVKTLEKRGWIR